MAHIQEIDKGLVIGELKGKHFVIVISLLRKLKLDIKKISAIIKKMQKMATTTKKENPNVPEDELKEIIESRYIEFLDELIKHFYKFI